jgi:hypothetical protein
MFAQFDGAEYVVVIGKLKELYSNYFRVRDQRDYRLYANN